jgi:hypothetical protein
MQVFPKAAEGIRTVDLLHGCRRDVFGERHGERAAERELDARA